MQQMVRAAIFFTLLGVTSAPAVQAQPKDRLVIGMGSLAASMHPLIGGQASRDYLLAISRRPVVSRNADGEVICLLCTEVPTVANGRAKVIDLADGSKSMEVTFTLRSGLKWGDGTPLTTKDIVFGGEVARAVNPMTNLTGVVARDEQSYTVMLNAVRFDFNRVTPDPINALIEEPIFRAATDSKDYGNKSAFNRTPDQPGLWNGPYLLTEFKANESVTFVPNPYWDGEKPAFKKVTVKLIPSSAALEANLLSGDIDIANGLGFDQDTDLEKHYASRFDVQMLPGTNVTNYVYLNIQTPILADKRVRQAISMGIDKQTIVDRLFGGRAAVANSIIATADPNYDKDLKPWPYDPAGARANLAVAGYKPGSDGILVRADGTRLSLDLIAGAGAATAGLVQQVVQSELKQIGIEAVAKAEPFRVLDGTTLPKRLYQGMVIEWESRAPGSLPLSTIGSTGIPSEANAFSGWNVTGYSNPHVDNLLRDALAELDPVKRQAMWDDIQATVMDDLPKIPLYNEAAIYVSPKWMTGIMPRRSINQLTLWIEYWKPK